MMGLCLTSYARWSPKVWRSLLALGLLAGLLGATVLAPAAHADALANEINTVARQWANYKYLSKSVDEQRVKMAQLNEQTRALVQRYPGRVEPMIWDGIVTSERASLTWGMKALGFANAARDEMLVAERMDPTALDAGAQTVLGVLYYRVPGFPLAWGDPKVARAYLESAVRNAPYGRDAHYFYADFLYEQGEYARAEQVLLRALQLPSHPERPLWDQMFPRVMQGLLQRVRAKM